MKPTYRTPSYLFRLTLSACLLLGFGVPMTQSLHAAAGYQKQLLRLHNRERAKRNLRPLRLHVSLNRAAADYARVMNKTKRFDHTGPDGSTVVDRVTTRCDCFKTLGENIAMGQPTAGAVTRAWVRSPGHRRNILNRRFIWVGFGKAGKAPFWVTKFGG